ncbi:histidine kinase [Kitasatospora sp. NPDC058965]|uniref:sensor histidine kinase n=1 Tax=Kitasatospora sp. NPDC058965 TaxID=3346682 RepID=UPI00367FD21B
MRGSGAVGWIGRGVVAGARGVVLGAVGLVAGVPLFAAAMVLSMLVHDGTSGSTTHGPYHTWALVLAAVVAGTGLGWLRRLTDGTRWLLNRWCGTQIRSPYRPLPVAHGTGQRMRRLGLLLADPATWRDLLWTGINACGGILLVLGPVLVVFYGLGVLAGLRGGSRPDGVPGLPPMPEVAPIAPGPAPRFGLADLLSHPLRHGALAVWVAVPLALVLVAVALQAAPRLLAGYGLLAAALLGPTRGAQLARRVEHLAITRSDTIDSGAAELRRIERDLHDGAQARLVAMGMTLSAAEQLFESSPEAARALLAEAKQSSARALAELRDLVRGIHPPVLADRGLSDAVHALALDLPLRVHFSGELPGRAPAPVESAGYFAVSELLANVSKHAAAHQVWIEVGHTGGALRIVVTDDGRGGADPARGTGLRGLERRLAAFDGVLAVSSPLGGPTIATLEIPCALSSPKTSSC